MPPDPYDAKDPVFSRVRKICLALPGAVEVNVEAWGHPTFRVPVGRGKDQKIFCGMGANGEARSIGWKCEPEVQHALVQSDPRFTIAAYVGKHGWVDFRPEGKLDWDFIAASLAESHRLVAAGKPAAAKKKPAAKPAPKTKTKTKKRAT